MAEYSNGSATDEQDLVDKIHTFLTSTIGGWERIDIVTDTASDKDYVYKSSGENVGLYRDIYARVRGYSNYVYFYGYSYWLDSGTNDGELYNSSYTRIIASAAPMDYWLFGNRDYFWVIVKVTTDLYPGGVGYLDSYYSPADDDLPMVVTGCSSSSYGYTATNRCRMYSPTISGYNVSVFSPATVQSQILVYGDPNDRDGSQAHLPYIMYCSMAGHSEVRGEMPGVLYFSGVNLSNEDWVTISGTDSKFFIRRYSDSVCEGYGPVMV